jgi:hypothetical protein
MFFASLLAGFAPLLELLLQVFGLDLLIPEFRVKFFPERVPAMARSSVVVALAHVLGSRIVPASMIVSFV